MSLTDPLDLKRMPLIKACADWLQRIHNSVPRIIRSTLESFYSSLLMVLNAVFAPSCMVTWVSLSAYVCAVSSMVWYFPIASERESRRKGSNQNRGGENIGAFIFFAMFLIPGVALALLMGLFYGFARYTDVLIGSIGEVQVIVCMLFAALVSTAFVILTVGFKVETSPTMSTIERKALMHTGLFSTVSALSVVVIRVVTDIQAFV